MALVVFTGGARSGKSAAAEALARSRALEGAAVTVVVFALADGDPEMAERVARHQADRPAHFGVVEAGTSSDLLDAVRLDPLLLVDCLGTLVGLVMSEEWPRATEGHDLVDAGGELPAGYADAVEERTRELVDVLCARMGDTIVVTNEVGDGIVPPYASGRLFRDVLGRANRRLVNAADRSYLTVCGRVIDLSTRAASPTWPED